MTVSQRKVLLTVAMLLFLTACVLLLVPMRATAYVYEEKTEITLSGLSTGITANNSADGSLVQPVSASAIYVTMPSNDIPYRKTDEWNDKRIRPVSNGVVTLNGAPLANAVLIKYGDNSYYLEFGEQVSANGKIIVDGKFYYDLDGNGVFDSSDPSVTIAPALFLYDGNVWSQVKPSFTLKYDGEAVSELIAMPATDVNCISATCDLNTAVSVSFPNNAVQGGKLTCLNGESVSVYKALLTTEYDGVTFEQYVNVTVGYNSFVMKNGASIRLAANGGMRFGAELSPSEYRHLRSRNAQFNIAQVKLSDLPDGAITKDFILNSSLVKHAECTPVRSGDVYELQGDFIGIDKQDYITEYVGVAYAVVDNDAYLARFFNEDIANNTRSAYYVAQLCIENGDNAETARGFYITPTPEQTARLVVKTVVRGNGEPIVETTVSNRIVGETVQITAPQKNGILLTANSVSQTVFINRDNEVTFEYLDINPSSPVISAWFAPYLDSADDYLNAYNCNILSKIKQAGINTFVLNGNSTGNITSGDDVERVRKIIRLFDSFGIKTVVDLKKDYFALDCYPDFSDCSGVIGVMQWDEPSIEIIDKVLKNYVRRFNEVYGDSPDVTFMCNLFPSEAPTGFFGKINGRNATYSQYLEYYCSEILAEVNGAKYLSVDSYPIFADYSLDDGFLTSIGLLKYYALKYGAQANVCLQSCGWVEGNDLKSRMPTEAEMRMQAYTALSFGMDSLSWFTYSNFTNSVEQPVDYETGAASGGYDALSNVNGELLALSGVYGGYEWKGAILNGVTSNEKVGFDKLLATEFSKYALTSQNTVFDDVTFNGNAIMGVFDSKSDVNGKAYAIVNYNSLADGGVAIEAELRSSSPITINVHKGRTVQTVVVDGTYKLTLQAGEGCFITVD